MVKHMSMLLLRKPGGPVRVRTYRILAIFLAAMVALLACVSRPAERVETPELLPIDPLISTGRLDNGLSFYVRANHRPEKRAELRLVVNAGSVLEDEDQRGLAHFVEHMAFNGTEGFEKQQIVDYMESIGMRFGPEVNAYTDFDETVYILTVPTDDPKIVETGVRILEEWAHSIRFDPVEVDKERPVIVEEWRLGRGAEARMEDLQLPVLYQGSRYAERPPIGKVEVVQNAPMQSLRRFYSDWYRPDLMAVIAVGDFDSRWMEELIKAHFNKLPAPPVSRERLVYPVPDHGETLYAPATDPETTSTRASLLIKRDVQPFMTAADYRRKLVASLYNGILNERLEELARQPDSPLLYGYSNLSRIVRSKEAYYLGAGVRQERIAEAMEILLTEVERVRRYGFTESELQRQKEKLATGMERLYKEREKLESSFYAREYISHFLEGDPIPGIDYEYELYRRYVPQISLAQVNALAGELLTEGNRVVMVNAPEYAKGRVPDKGQVLALFQRVRATEIKPYDDRLLEQPLFQEQVVEGKVLSSRQLPELGVTEWRLANGVRVVLKPTDFKEDQILFSAFSPGGSSLVPDREYVAAVTAASLVVEGGLDGFDATQLRKKLAGKAVSVTPYIGELYEGFRGGGRPEDLETLFQLIHLYFTEPRRDEAAYRGYQERLREVVKNRQASPEVAFSDEVQELISQNHFRARPWSTELLQEMNLDESLSIYRDRYRDAGDFTFVFVGAFTPERIEPLVTRYLGSLPSTGRVESWRDVGMNPPRGVIRQELRKGLEPKSLVEFVFSGSSSWSLQRRLELQALAEILNIKLREVIREEAGGSYDVEVNAELRHYPDEEYFIYIDFGCAPNQVETLSGYVLEQIARLHKDGPVSGDLVKVKEILRREHEQNLKENEYWLGTLQLAYSNGLDPLAMLDFDQRLEALSPEVLRQTALEHLKLDNYVRVVLYPQQ